MVDELQRKNADLENQKLSHFAEIRKIKENQKSIDGVSEISEGTKPIVSVTSIQLLIILSLSYSCQIFPNIFPFRHAEIAHPLPF